MRQRQTPVTTVLQAITKALKNATSRWEAVEPAFLKLPEGQVVVVHMLIHGHQSVTRLEKPDDITKNRLTIALSHTQILGYYRFDGGTWELASTMLTAVAATIKGEPLLFEEQVLEKVLAHAVVRDDLTTPVPEDEEEFFLHRVGDEQCITMAVAGGDFSLVPEHPLGRLTAPKGTVGLYWPVIENERESARRARDLSSLLGELIGSVFSAHHDHSSHEETDEPGEVSSRDFFSDLSSSLGRGVVIEVVGKGGRTVSKEELERALKAREEGDINPLLELYGFDPSMQGFIRTSHARNPQRPGEEPRASEPAPGMGASEGKDMGAHDKGEQPYVTAGLASTRRGQAASNIG